MHSIYKFHDFNLNISGKRAKKCKPITDPVLNSNFHCLFMPKVLHISYYNIYSLYYSSVSTHNIFFRSPAILKCNFRHICLCKSFIFTILFTFALHLGNYIFILSHNCTQMQMHVLAVGSSCNNSKMQMYHPACRYLYNCH